MVKDQRESSVPESSAGDPEVWLVRLMKQGVTLAV